MRIGAMRVSTAWPSPGRQYDALKRAGRGRLHDDAASGAAKDRAAGRDNTARDVADHLGVSLPTLHAYVDGRAAAPPERRSAPTKNARGVA